MKEDAKKMLVAGLEEALTMQHALQAVLRSRGVVLTHMTMEPVGGGLRFIIDTREATYAERIAFANGWAHAGPKHTEACKRTRTPPCDAFEKREGTKKDSCGYCGHMEDCHPGEVPAGYKKQVFG